MILSIVDIIRNPIYQLIFFVLITLLFLLFKKNKDANYVWYAAGLFYIGFILTNSLLVWFADASWLYFFTSLAYSLLYILVMGILISSIVNLLKLTGSGETAMIFIYIIYHPITLLVVIGVKWLFGLILGR